MESGAPPRRCLAGVGGSHRPLAGPTRPLEPDPPVVTRTRTTYATTSAAPCPPERLAYRGVAVPLLLSATVGPRGVNARRSYSPMPHRRGVRTRRESPLSAAQ